MNHIEPLKDTQTLRKTGQTRRSIREGRDIDLAVEGLAPEEFFRFYGDLLFSLSKPVDLVDLSQDSKFTRLIRREGLPLYDVTQAAG